MRVNFCMGVKRSSLFLVAFLLVTIGFIASVSSADDVFVPECEIDADCVPENSCTIGSCIEGICEYFPEEDVPDTDTVFLTRDDGTDLTYCQEGYVYVNFPANDVVVNFYSEDSCTDLERVEYLKSYTNTYWEPGAGFEGYSSEEEWYSSIHDDDWEFDEYKVCGRARDNNLNQENDGLTIDEVPLDDCCMVCFDREEPGQVMNVIHSNPSECVPEYVNVNPEFSWDEPEDYPECSGIDYYEVELYLSDGTLVDTYDTEGTTFEVTEPENGQDYYVKIRAVDLAGNIGEWSSESEHVYYDNEDPMVEIVSPPQGTWFNTDFEVMEVETDNTGLYQCEYAILNNGEILKDWADIDCTNETISVNISEFCPEDGTCSVDKRVTDYACNEYEMRAKYYNIDREAPKTTKDVSTPKYEGRNFLWMGIEYVLDLFITSDTEISFTCDDGEGIGCNSTYYRYKFNDGNWTEWKIYSEAFSFENDGVYTLEYYSDDELGNTEETIQGEIDKVDNEAPVTVKTIGEPKYYDEENERLWVNNYTEFELSCSDSEVGCSYTYYQLEDNDPMYENSEENNVTFTFADFEVEDGEYMVYYWSRDHLGNIEEKRNETDWLDTHFPIITVHNPTEDERNVYRCTQAIVVEVEELGSGLNSESVYAELVNEYEEVVSNVTLVKTQYGTYEAMMDKALPAGEYSLLIYAEDNVENENIVEIDEILEEEAIFVEYVSPASCSVDSELGGDCDLTLNICMRGGNQIQMWMNKIDGIVTPGMINAETSKNNDTTFVGLKHEEGEGYFVSDAGYLPLLNECEDVNGRTNFDLHLEFGPEDVQSIGPGAHQLQYWLESSFEESYCVPGIQQTVN